MNLMAGREVALPRMDTDIESLCTTTPSLHCRMARLSDRPAFHFRHDFYALRVKKVRI